MPPTPTEANEITPDMNLAGYPLGESIDLWRAVEDLYEDEGTDLFLHGLGSLITCPGVNNTLCSSSLRA